MHRRIRSFAGVVVLAMVVEAAPVAAAQDFAKKFYNAREAFTELMESPDRGVPQWLLDRTKCVAVVPSVIKGAFIWGGRHGRGVMSCRDEEGAWSPPMFVKISGGSFGFQAGGEATDLVLFFLTERGVRSLLDTKFVLGADVGLAAGPLGRSAEATTDLKFKAEIYSYARSKGLYGGVAIQGARLAPDYSWARGFYGERVWPDEILFRHEAPRMTPDAQAFLDVLP